MVFTRSYMKREWMKEAKVEHNRRVSTINSKRKAIMKPPSSAKFLEDAMQSPLKSKAKAIRKFPSSCAKFLEDIPVIR